VIVWLWASTKRCNALCDIYSGETLLGRHSASGNDTIQITIKKQS
jgi:hypothetical protein